MTVWKFEFRADGEQLAVSAQIDPDTPSIRARQRRAPGQSVRLVDAATFEDEPVQLGGIPESAVPVRAALQRRRPASRRVSFEDVGRRRDATAPSSCGTWRRRNSRCCVRPSGRCLGRRAEPRWQPALRRQLDPPAVTVYDVATGRRCARRACRQHGWRSAPTARCSPPPVATRSSILDAATPHRAPPAAGPHRAFRRSASRPAARCSPRAPTTHRHRVGRRHRRTPGAADGPRRASVGCRLQPRRRHAVHRRSGRTLLTWDLDGDRRFIARLPLAEPAAPADGARASPTGEAVAYAGADAARQHLQFLDVGTGRAGPLIDTGHWCYGAGSAWRLGRAGFATAGERRFRPGLGLAHRTVITERHVAPDAHPDWTTRVTAGDSWSSNEPAPRTRSTPRRWNPTDRPVDGRSQHVRQPGQPHRRVFTAGRFCVDLDNGVSTTASPPLTGVLP